MIISRSLKKGNTVIVVLSLIFILGGCGLSKEAEQVQKMIQSLPYEYSESYDTDINEANDAYEALSESDKQQVKSEQLIELLRKQQQNKEDKIQKIANNVNEKIEMIKLEADNSLQIIQAVNEISELNKIIADTPIDADKYIHWKNVVSKIDGQGSRSALAYQTAVYKSKLFDDTMNKYLDSVSIIKDATRSYYRKASNLLVEVKDGYNKIVEDSSLVTEEARKTTLERLEELKSWIAKLESLPVGMLYDKSELYVLISLIANDFSDLFDEFEEENKKYGDALSKEKEALQEYNMQLEKRTSDAWQYKIDLNKSYRPYEYS